MDKFTVARLLDEIARYLELSESNPFKTRAYERAARSVEKLDRDLTEIVAAGELLDTPGIGKGIAPIIEEITASGTARMLEELRAAYPPGIFELLRVPRLGLKKIGLLHAELGIASIDDLEIAARSGRLAKLKGFGAKTQAQILEGIAWARKRESQFLLTVGLEVAAHVLEQLGAIDAIGDAEVTGSVRRRLEVIRNVDIAIATDDREAVIVALAGIVAGLEVIEADLVQGVARGEMPVRFHLAEPKDFGARVLLSTGSTEFVTAFSAKLEAAQMGFRDGQLIRNGRALTTRTEHELFEKCDVAFLDPERRETGEDLRRKTRVKLVQPSDLRGTFHVHTTWSDGRNSMLEMLTAARARGFDYVGVSDHSRTAYYAGGLTESQLHEQWAEIDSHREEVLPLQVFRGTEADILQDGSIDYGANVLSQFDFVVASIHSNFTMPEDQMTERILTALDDPHVTFLGHMTGRLLLSRDGYKVDYARIFDRAAARGVIIEINGSPKRLDVDWRHIGEAVERGVTFGIHPDAHSIHEMANVITGTWVARKAGLTAKHIFNTRSHAEVRQHLDKRRKAAEQ